MQLQPLAINPKIFENCFLNYEKNIISTMQLFGKIKDFHQIYKDSKGEWNLELKKISDNFGHEEKSMFDALLIRNLSENSFDVDITETNFLKAIAQKTPDLLLISDDKIPDINCYTQKAFITDDYRPNNILYRIPKSVIVKPHYQFRNFDFIAPYIRNASKIEIMDKQLFKDTKNDSEIIFLFDVIKKIKQLKEIQLYWEPNNNNLRHLGFIKKVKEIFPNIEILQNVQYTSRSKNHDRFIIVDNTELSIRFTCSFNNFYFENGNYLSKAGFSIIYEKGRSYYK